ncbi:MAG TPA: glutaredoxin family protein [Symbiobacteriaceae bacterium]|jgi:glutaredoxin|nr:glutaredoxin family protein [Symbiobacteriaceae bacterium]
MPLRPDLPSGLNLSRRATTPVKLPKMNFPMIGNAPDAAPQADSNHYAPPDAVEGTVPLPEERPVAAPVMPVQPITRAPAAPAVPKAPVQAQGPARVTVYGTSGCMACLEAIQDLIDRQISFTYYDVARDAQAMAHLQAISGNAQPVVPVIIYFGCAAGA